MNSKSSTSQALRTVGRLLSLFPVRHGLGAAVRSSAERRMSPNCPSTLRETGSYRSLTHFAWLPCGLNPALYRTSEFRTSITFLVSTGTLSIGCEPVQIYVQPARALRREGIGHFRSGDSNWANASIDANLALLGPSHPLPGRIVATRASECGHAEHPASPSSVEPSRL